MADDIDGQSDPDVSEEPGRRGIRAPFHHFFQWLDDHSKGLTALAALLIPLAVGVSGAVVNSTISQRDVEARQLELAISILQVPVEAEDEGRQAALRSYAVDLLALSSPVQLSAELRQQLIVGEVSLAGGSRFSDVVGNPYADEIEALADAGITRGCSPPSNDLYCPEQPVTRGNLASYLVRAFGPPPPADDSSSFRDLEGNLHRQSVVALEGIISVPGCTTAAYCPNEPATRAELARLLWQLLNADAGAELPDRLSPVPEPFDDVSDSARSAPAIRGLQAYGLAMECAPNRFCPDQIVTRAALAAFLSEPLELLDENSQ